MTTPSERSLGQRAQSAYEQLTRGNKVPDTEYKELVRARARLAIHAEKTSGVFDFGDHSLNLGSDSTEVIVHARTSSGNEEGIRLGLNPDGSPKFRICTVAELIEDPA